MPCQPLLAIETRQSATDRLPPQVLSNPQDRAWYDAHRQQILREDSDQHLHAKLIDADDLAAFFASSAYSGFGDSADAFFGVYRAVFARVAVAESAEDDALSSQERLRMTQSSYPGFGNPASPRAEVEAFYSFWGCFSSTRSFSHCDQWQTYQSHDRRTRREAEKRNNRLREAARKRFSDTVTVRVYPGYWLHYSLKRDFIMCFKN